jgi:hypothetical protein
MHLLAVLVLAAASVRGVVSSEGPLPGCIVTLTSPEHGERRLVTDKEGAYRFAAVATGQHTLQFAVEGFVTSTRTITVAADAESVHDVELNLDQAELTLNCAMSNPCSDSPPRYAWDLPTCADYQLDTLLVEAIERNDRSAIGHAQKRFAAAVTYAEKHRLAEALLRRVPNDAEYWNELQEHARNSIRFGGNTPAFEEWCAQHGLPPEDYRWMALNALRIAGSDPRGRPLLLDSLKLRDAEVLSTAIGALALNGDVRALPAIDRALEAIGEDAQDVAMFLGLFGTKEADEIAHRHIAEHRRDEYDQSYRAPAR